MTSPQSDKVTQVVAVIISVLIPALNEAPSIETVVGSCQSTPTIEVIVVDGGSRDGTPEAALRCGARVFYSEPGRARQMNLAAAKAQGEIYLFLHADTYLPANFEHCILSTLSLPRVVGGAFRLAIRSNALSLRLIEHGVNLRSRLLQMPYGDQGLFLRAETFSALNGFSEIEFMEDFDFVRRLRRLGRIGFADAFVSTSARRWERLGPWRTTLINQLAIVAYLVGVSPSRIARFYGSRKPAKEGKE